jgi:dihydrolipoamide dehydrogenase
VTLIEKDKLGGTCLNRGCIPTKALLKSSELLSEIKDGAKFGVHIEGEAEASFKDIIERKNKLVSQLAKGIEFLLIKNGVRIIKGTGRLIDRRRVEVMGDGFAETLEADRIILATGSIPACPWIFGYDGKNVITSDEVLSLEEAPGSVIIAGGGVIGCEMGQFLRRMGSDVTIVEMMPHILPQEDDDVAKQLERQFKKEKIRFITGQGITSVRVDGGKVIASLQDGNELNADVLMVSIGRKPFTQGLGLENAGIHTDERGMIPVNRKMETCVEGIYAIGDLVASPALAHVASKEGLIAAENAVGGNREISYHAVPRCVYTDPEIASVGINEAEAGEKGIPYKIGTFEFRGLGKALVMDKIQGFVKVLTDENDRLIGASIVGPGATELLAELTLAVHLGLSAEQVGDVIHPHPTLCEALMEALHDIHGQSIHKI